MIKKLIVCLITLPLFYTLNGQIIDRLQAEFIVEGVTLKNPLAGGLNSPQLSEVDLNNDGKQDLFIFDRVGNKVLTFLNEGNAGESDYVFAPEYISQFPPMEEWVLLRDYNGDGIVDIFAYSDQQVDGVMVYTGYYDGDKIAFNRFNFNAPLNIIFIPINNGGTTQLYVSTIDYPAVDDMDCDGDLDILTFGLGGGYVDLFCNQSVEMGYGTDSLIFKLCESCWGGFYESGISTVVDLAAGPGECFNGLQQDEDLEFRHAGSTLLTYDGDNDGDKELILGDLSFTNLNYLINGGTCGEAWINNQDETFPSYDVVFDVPIYPASFYLDVNNDGKKDLIGAVNARRNAEDNELWFYENVTSTEYPVFAFQDKEFLISDMIDIGSGARPQFIDYNADGLQDLILSNYSFYEPFGMFNARVFLFENIGTAAVPAFELVNDDFLGLNAFTQTTRYFAPAFGDMDNDGDLDVIIGEQNGMLFYGENIAGPNQPLQYNNLTYNYMNINVGQASTPQIVDLNRDGLLDLLIGSQVGRISYYQNMGTAEVAEFNADPELAPNQKKIGNVDARIPGYSTGFSTPLFVDIDGQFKLFMGTETGRIEVYSNIDGNLDGEFDLDTESFGDLKEGFQTHLAMADLDQNGLMELIVGNYRGGISGYHTNIPSGVNTNTQSPLRNLGLKLYPNPAAERVTLALPTELVGEKILELYNATGQQLLRRSWSGQRTELALDAFPAGIYWIRVLAGNGMQTKRLVVQ
ncbi:MAG: hypothetical protein DHS20C18_09640 [Saprospiraceae bacterium]|nr:MAG: hypothetical protein DHS20C18_09640 [Saprospiraceae bacterium]